LTLRKKCHKSLSLFLLFPLLGVFLIATYPNAVRYDGPLGASATRPHLLGFDDGNRYVTKFRGNPEGDKVLASEYIASELIRELAFAGIPSKIVTVDAAFISNQPELTGLTAGLQFGSFHERDNQPFSPAAISRLTNRDDLPQVLVFDTYVVNGDRHPGNILLVEDPTRSSLAYRFAMIDHSHIFGTPRWDSHSLRSFHGYSTVPISALNYGHVGAKFDVFEPFLSRLEALAPSTIQSIIDGIPSEWGVPSTDRAALKDFLEVRRSSVRPIFRAALGGP
jgi:hypothetical protein